ncbi:hypothetical protein AYK26_01095 [Euryarchaeota archaeon SM23-78]|nr:MAG: hypothetical protein AYK26_01095 [Euryarchaeota archaeon SM23-78]MBW3001230.1 hypothetical protein [Candidatus Woesearchaeota archaeon]
MATEKQQFVEMDYGKLTQLLGAKSSDEIEAIIKDCKTVFSDKKLKEEEKEAARVERDIHDINNEVKAIIEKEIKDTGAHLEWHTKKGYERLVKIQKDLNDIQSAEKEKIKSHDKLKEWFVYMNEQVNKVLEAWDEKSKPAERKAALEKLSLSRMTILQDLVNRIHQFEEVIEKVEEKK